MPLYPSTLIPWVPQQFLDADGNPLNGGKVYTYIAGTTTPKPTYTDANQGGEQTNPIILDAEGRPPSPIFMGSGGYKFRVDDAEDNQLYTVDLVVDAGLTFAETFGNIQAEGSKDVSSGYTQLAADRLITVDSTETTNPCVINLLPADEATQMLVILNLAAVPLSVTPDGSDTINGAASAFTVDAAAGAVQPAAILFPSGGSAWYALRSGY